MSEFNTQDVAELKKILADKREGLRVFRFEGAGSRSRNTRGARGLRKEIARILTELRSREIASVVKSK